MNKSVGKITVNKVEISTKKVGESVYISLTDIARLKNSTDPSDVIKKWMSNKDSFDFYSLWEELSNEHFNLAESRRIKFDEVGLNVFIMTPSRWKKTVNALGIVSGAGKYSEGTFAHPDIAFEFASWIDTGFKLYLIKEFQRLKIEESKQLEWNAMRELAKLNYKIHTNAIKENIVPSLKPSQINFAYTSEADLLNTALFGMTASEWRKENPNLDGNIRDHTSIQHLLVLANLESQNATMINENIPPDKRLVKLNEIARYQLPILMQSSSPLLEDKKKGENI